MNICLLIHSLESGGMERVMSELAQYFEKKGGTEVSLILYGKSRGTFFPVPDKVHIYRPSFKFSDHLRILSTIKTMWFLRDTIKNIDPDTILSVGEYWNNFGLFSLLSAGYPVFISDRGQPDKSLGKLHDRLRKWLYPKASGIVTQTSAAKEIYQRWNLNKNIKTIGNPIHSIPENGCKEKENIILTVGRLIENEHHEQLIRIFSELSASGWKLVIVGENALKQNRMGRLKKLVKELEIEEKVELTGTVADIEYYYNRSKIFAFTSSSEGFPNVIGEAMSAGLPVVAYDCVSGPSDMINHGKNGYLVDVFDDEQFKQFLLQLTGSKKLRERMGTEAERSI